jgi:DNA-binding NtrC family response regulator
VTAPASVVVVDDDIDHAVIIGAVVRRVLPDAAVLTLTDPMRVAGRLVDEAPTDALVLIDRVLGAGEAFEAVAAVAAQRPDLTLVMMSSVIDPTDRRRAVECGATLAVEKPGTLAEWEVLIGHLAGLSSSGIAVA